MKNITSSLSTTSVKILVIIFVSASLLPSCKSQKVDAGKADENSQPIVSMNRTACFGRCPIYKIELYENGTLFYEGVRFVQDSGKFYGKLSKNELATFQERLEKADIFSMKDKYPSDYPSPVDLPSCVLTYYKNGSSKKIVDYGQGAPAVLVQLEQELDSLVKTKVLHSSDK